VLPGSGDRVEELTPDLVDHPSLVDAPCPKAPTVET
jgi:hypothetical protein